ncbi:MAG: hypothetical protein IKS05_08785, partial [Oscillospiraceae bacterium]|nr:hypothetical protein [Oscillospiraceae bacterium]
SSPLSCLGTLRIFRTALISEACWICLRQIAFVPNAGLLTLAGKSSPYSVFAALSRSPEETFDCHWAEKRV